MYSEIFHRKVLVYSKKRKLKTLLKLERLLLILLTIMINTNALKQNRCNYNSNLG